MANAQIKIGCVYLTLKQYDQAQAELDMMTELFQRIRSMTEEQLTVFP